MRWYIKGIIMRSFNFALPTAPFRIAQEDRQQEWIRTREARILIFLTPWRYPGDLPNRPDQQEILPASWIHIVMRKPVRYVETRNQWKRDPLVQVDCSVWFGIADWVSLGIRVISFLLISYSSPSIFAILSFHPFHFSLPCPDSPSCFSHTDLIALLQSSLALPLDHPFLKRKKS